MSMIPISSAMTLRASRSASTDPFSGSKGWVARYGTQEVSQFRGAEMIAEKWEHLARGHGALRAREPPARDPRDRRGPLRARDRAARRRAAATRARAATPRLEKMAKLKPLAPGGRLTAARLEPDLRRRVGAARRVGARGEDARPASRARASTTSACAATIPIWMLTAPIPATRYALAKAGHEARRDRPRRDQRGLRLGRARLAEGDRRGPRARST